MGSPEAYVGSEENLLRIQLLDDSLRLEEVRQQQKVLAAEAGQIVEEMLERLENFKGKAFLMEGQIKASYDEQRGQIPHITSGAEPNSGLKDVMIHDIVKAGVWVRVLEAEEETLLLLDPTSLRFSPPKQEPGQ